MQLEHLEFGLCLYSMLLSEHKRLLCTMNKRDVRNIVEKTQNRRTIHFYAHSVLA